MWRLGSSYISTPFNLFHKLFPLFLKYNRTVTLSIERKDREHIGDICQALQPDHEKRNIRLQTNNVTFSTILASLQVDDACKNELQRLLNYASFFNNPFKKHKRQHFFLVHDP